MQALIIHLSDIHISEASDEILKRTERITDAIGALPIRPETCVLLVSGDIAATGNENEFYLAHSFLETVKDNLSRRWKGSSRIEVVAVPGNHDCKFTGPLGARKTLIDAMNEKGVCEPDQSIIDACTAVQEPFFNFLASLPTKPVSESRIYYEYLVPVGNETISIRCFNTAWVSVLHETQPGRILLPHPTNVFDLDSKVAISVLHHPLNWFHKDTRRETEKMLRDISDVVLTGHEHVPDDSVRIGHGGDVTFTLEGGCLQDPKDAKVSEFAVLLLDLEGVPKQKLIRFEWRNDIYVQMAGDWEPMISNPRRTRTETEIAPAMQESLDDLGMIVSHPAKDPLRLQDIFVYPDIRKISMDDKDDLLIKNDHLIDELLSLPISLISGIELSGKTSLAKMLFRDLHLRHFVPILLEGESIKVLRDDHALDQVFTAFRRQYSNTDADHLRQRVKKQHRVLIIDNFDRARARIKKANWTKFVQLLSEFFGNLIILTNEIVQDFEDMVTGPVLDEVGIRVQRYRMLGFSGTHRDALVKKWLGLYGDDLSDGDYAEKMALIERLLDSMVSTQFLPPYPYYILPLIQTADGTSANMTRAASQAYFAEALIKISLTRPELEVDPDTCEGALMWLAYALFIRRRTKISQAEFEQIHAGYQKEYLRGEVKFERLKSSAIQAKLIREQDGYFSFRYKHIYHYFCASYFDKNIDDPEIRGWITTMSHSLYRDEYASIMLFLAYLTSSSFVVQEMIGRAQEFYSGTTPSALGDDVVFLNQFSENSDNKDFTLEDIEEVREKRLEKSRNETVPESGYSPDAAYEEPFDQIMSPFHGSLKMVQILGQVLKNRAGTTKREKKLEVARECHLLGLRILGNIFDLVKGDEEGLVLDIAARLFDDKVIQALPERERVAAQLASDSRKIARSLFTGASFGIIKRVAFSLGSPNLLETHKIIVEESPTPAMRLIFTAMSLEQSRLNSQETIETSVELEKRPFASALLRLLVMEHFYLYPSDIGTRQKVCTALGIKLVQGTDPRRKLLN